jgi:hypothetical protein
MDRSTELHMGYSTVLSLGCLMDRLTEISHGSLDGVMLGLLDGLLDRNFTWIAQQSYAWVAWWITKSNHL